MKNLLLQSFSGIIILLMAATLFAHDHKNNEEPGNIVQTAASAGQFETLLAAAKAAGLVPALSGDGPLTVFAPTDEAFGALPAGTIKALLKPQNRDKLARILTYHVVSGQIASDALADEVSLKTLAGPSVLFTQSEQGFTIEGARIVATDIAASNGIVHVIDRVIMPPQQMSRADAEQMIMSAISKGVPMFNHGNPQATAEIYKMTAETLMENAILRPAERDRLMKALADNAGSDSAEEIAWKLRYALDDVIASMGADISM
ncbi:fasciclin domain-containing protein [Glaciecola petra]|uniref:Fasciclin domain-containing protein n=1 Tax=Glaciecola petra TaxID=3075602 RepID=A0ABU2ZS59_9ALTE|nr:fasciclin domain-containing protein [Aestuariibacter sp. P117]MDT0595470.1 fasciclin domain-containing protein [Aestuariibacter sp. P117]